jgi:hypothetical protein
MNQNKIYGDNDYYKEKGKTALLMRYLARLISYLLLDITIYSFEKRFKL